MVIHYVSEFQKVTYRVEHMIYVSGCLVYRSNTGKSINFISRYQTFNNDAFIGRMRNETSMLDWGHSLGLLGAATSTTFYCCAIADIFLKIYFSMDINEIIVFCLTTHHTEVEPKCCIFTVQQKSLLHTAIYYLSYSPNLTVIKKIHKRPQWEGLHLFTFRAVGQLPLSIDSYTASKMSSTLLSTASDELP